ncbi:hypothetical protein LOOC260_101490 [Paucilactobacillus hokkaidonensis JCM 18461]|uniref:Uncharacterized protein n=2 Tax=Paucilactobacillus hokkaidonensis TaxID=1193095 RepID=A0A0A1GR14_9LACO|nr:hypothetical protein [Paucilactobacillus hokkaidonensis]KRO09839.1 hypothetical protein IV59_GL000307 [Paucilactobacillus hokkaidonensis]BAP84727.1 hypothetical protein LOOC260_101490 [Paucilactobacillus hokkaidonensis JCM 18461]
MTNTKLLKPADLQSVLSHDKTYRRAVNLLLEKWDPAENHLFSDLVKSSDVLFAKKLQVAGLVPGKFQLDNYQQVQQFISAHDQWLTAAAKKELMQSFT